MIEIEELDEDEDEKACISCKHRHFNGKHNECTVDGHYIGYLALWLQTCKYHSLEEKRD